MRCKIQYFNWDRKNWREAQGRFPRVDGTNVPDVLGEAAVGGRAGSWKDDQCRSGTWLFNPHVEEEGDELTA